MSISFLMILLCEEFRFASFSPVGCGGTLSWVSQHISYFGSHFSWNYCVILFTQQLWFWHFVRSCLRLGSSVVSQCCHLTLPDSWFAHSFQARLWNWKDQLVVRRVPFWCQCNFWLNNTSYISCEDSFFFILNKTFLVWKYLTVN